MCGLSGFFTATALTREDQAIARAMGQALQHRGPDDHGEWLDQEAGIALAHRRLAVVDLSPAGQQPMVSADGRWVISFNGEIYNHVALRQRLQQEAHALAWRGHSDTETLLACIACWGLPEALRSSLGMFALAVWDRRERALFLARDRLGEKPLYYGLQKGVLLFGSELKALHRHPAFERSIDRGALALMLRFGYVPAPWSIYSGIFKLPPGSFLRVTTPQECLAVPTPFWSLSTLRDHPNRQPAGLSDEEATDELDRLLRQSIAGQRLADVPLGAFLSGGIDSSTVVALMQATATTPVRSFTIGLPDAALDESAAARRIASHLGTEHTEMIVTADDALRVIPQLPAMYCEPFGDVSQIPTFLVSQLARQTVTVALSGDAGDELFGGYDRYRWAQRMAGVPLPLRRFCGLALGALPAETWSRALAPLSRWLPQELKDGDRADRLRKLSAVLRAQSDDAVYRQLVSFWPEDQNLVPNAGSLHTAFNQAPDLSQSFEQRMMLLDMATYLPDDILVKVDRAAMAVSLETRVPLLDHRIIEFALTLPLHQKMRHGQGKWLLRQVLRRYVPDALVQGPKRGFGIPIHAWLRGPLRAWAEDLLSAQRLRRGGWVHAEPIRILWREHLEQRNDWGYRLWPVLMFEAWREASGLGEASR